MLRITVAVCTWNRSKLLDQTLTAMERLVIPVGVEWEILVVNNNCTDDTEAVAGRHAGRLPLRHLFEPRKGKSNAANRVLDEASGDLILWTDDDILVGPHWLSSLVEAVGRNPEAAGFGGPIEPWFPTPPDPAMTEAFPALKTGFCGLDHECEEGPLPLDRSIWGSNMAFRREAVGGIHFETALGPNPRSVGSGGRNKVMSMGGGEDEEYLRRVREAGGEIIWVPGMSVRHYVDPARMTLDYLREFYAEFGRVITRRFGVPEGPRCFGIPRWIVRAWVEAGIESLYFRCSGGRTAYLKRARLLSYYRGIMGECWSIRRMRENSSLLADRHSPSDGAKSFCS